MIWNSRRAGIVSMNLNFVSLSGAGECAVQAVKISNF